MIHLALIAGIAVAGTAATTITTINGKIKGKSDAEINEDCAKIAKPFFRIARVAFRGK